MRWLNNLLNSTGRSTKLQNSSAVGGLRQVVILRSATPCIVHKLFKGLSVNHQQYRMLIITCNRAEMNTALK